MTPELIKRLLKHQKDEWWPKGLRRYESDTHAAWVQNGTQVDGEALLVGAMAQWLLRSAPRHQQLLLSLAAIQLLVNLLDAIEAEDTK